MNNRLLLLGAFFVSGAAGLAYELVWSRYLALLLGHSAYAQMVVIAVYLGGMGVGAAIIGQRTRRIGRPLVWYARAEILLALMGLLFHPVFRVVIDAAYEFVLPGIPESWALLLPWLLSVLLILPQAVLLGATFPLMTAGLLRAFPSRGAGLVADAYLWNSLGGAVGILAAGFLLIPLLGTLGCLVVAATGNLVAATVAFRFAPKHGRATAYEPLSPDPPDADPASLVSAAAVSASVEPDGPVATGAAPGDAADLDPRLLTPILVVAFGTAVASFMYEIGWIRMLSLLMGSATHSFELMLSAFIFGLAVGARLIRGRVDASRSPVRLLGIVQWLMGCAALATLPLYAASFGLMSELLGTVSRDASGYALFNGARYSLALMVMLPSTVAAGATLPLMTGILLRAGVGERSVGWVYGVNTFGSVTGVIAAGLILMPLLGLKGLLVAGAVLDMALGIGLLMWSRGVGVRSNRPLAAAAGAGATAVAVAAAALLLVELDQAVLTSGVFRTGEMPAEGSREMLFYHDGRTSTVGVHLGQNGLMVLTSNGKPDASLPVEWLNAVAGADVAVAPIADTDAATQTLASIVLMAHAPTFATGVNIGHGSGMSADALLTSPSLSELITVEIEPAMVRGSHFFLPANARAFDDRRHRFVFDDARAYLARSGRRFDLFLSEPSNPWVSGTASLFTEEFYRRAREHLAEGGVFGQWLQLYEMEDRLVASVLAAIHRVFPDYHAFMIGSADLLIVAGDRIPEPDWSVVDQPELRRALAHLPPLDADHLESLRLFDRALMAPLLDGPSVPANSDFRPILEAGAERARFRRDVASGTLSFGQQRFDLGAALVERRRAAPGPYRTPTVVVIEPMRIRARTRWFADQRRVGTDVAPAPFQPWRTDNQVYGLLMGRMARRVEPADWRVWLNHFTQVEAFLHGRTAGWADEVFYADTRTFLTELDAPTEIRTSVDFMHALASWDWPAAARTADLLDSLDDPPIDAALLVDGGVTAYLRLGRPDDARLLLERREDATGRAPDDLRSRLLRAWIDAATRADSGGSGDLGT